MGPTIMGTMRQRFTAALLLVSLLLIPIAPLLSASARDCSAQVCACCRRKGHHNCGMLHSLPMDGPAWNAVPQCGCGWRQLLTFLSPFPSTTPKLSGAMPLSPAIFQPAGAFPPRCAQASLLAWRHQRPPPLPERAT